jgi:hypothetical protein
MPFGPVPAPGREKSCPGAEPMDDAKLPRERTVESVRQTDLEPYTALRWVGTLFKAAALFLAVAIVAEFVAGLRAYGMATLPTLLGELARTIVLALVLWGGGDLVRLLIQLGHDIRAERILLARLVHRTPMPDGVAPAGARAAGLGPEELLGSVDVAEDAAAGRELHRRTA